MSETGAATSAAERLSLANWRRRVSDLYAEVRSAATTDPEGAWNHWREVREALFRTHPDSPVPVAERAGFRARHWRYDPALRFTTPLVDEPPAAVTMAPGMAAAAPGLASAAPELPFAAPALAFGGPLGGLSLQLPMSVGEALDFQRIGVVDVPFPAGPRRLAAYWMAGYAGGIFLPFRDASNGAETYGAGRYLLDTAKSADLGTDARGNLILDFNFAFQPSCAFDPAWSCPLAPPENRLDIRVEAGERIDSAAR